jgi:hypothetical protein
MPRGLAGGLDVGNSGRAMLFDETQGAAKAA